MLAEQQHEPDFTDAALHSWKVSRSKASRLLHRDPRGGYCAPSAGGLSLSDFRVTGELPGRKFRIFRAEHIASGQPVVLKAISRTLLAREPAHAQRRIRSEIEIHSRLEHADVIGFLGMFHDAAAIYLVLELAPHGDLESALLRQPGQRLDEARAAPVAAAVARALRYLHARGVAHRDVKPGNVLLGAGGEARLADFGLAKEFAPPPRGGAGGAAAPPPLPPQMQQQRLRRMHSVVGTPDFIAPDVLAPRRAGYDQKCDMWSLGALIYQMLVGQAPFYVEDIAETYDRIARADFVFPDGPDAPSQDAQQLIAALLHVDPKRRLTPAQVLASRWIVTHCGKPGPARARAAAAGLGAARVAPGNPAGARPAPAKVAAARLRPQQATYAARRY